MRKAGTKKALAATVAAKSPKITAVKVKKAKKIRQQGSKPKIVRDSFSMPQSDYAKIGELSAAQLKTALTALEKIKSGRAKKD